MYVRDAEMAADVAVLVSVVLLCRRRFRAGHHVQINTGFLTIFSVSVVCCFVRSTSSPGRRVSCSELCHYTFLACLMNKKSRLLDSQGRLLVATFC